MAGINQSMETFVSQTMGQSNYEMCGMYYNRANFLWISAYIPYILLACNSSYFLKTYFNQEPKTSEYTELFLVTYIPGLFMWGLCDILRKYLNCFQKANIPFLSYLLTSVLHPLWCYYFVIVLNLKI